MRLQYLARWRLGPIAPVANWAFHRTVTCASGHLPPLVVEDHMPKKSPNLTDKHVGSRVRMRRMMLDMSQTELGNSIGLTFQQVQKYEKGTNRIGAGRLHQIARILKVPVSFFFEGSPRDGAGASEVEQAPLPTYVADFLAT